MISPRRARLLRRRDGDSPAQMVDKAIGGSIKTSVMATLARWNENQATGHGTNPVVIDSSGNSVVMPEELIVAGDHSSGEIVVPASSFAADRNPQES
jgi:hypothetical protein